MTGCELFESADIELYFYAELDPVDRARVEAHLRACEACRQRLEDLHAIRRALASRPVVDAPAAGDWSGFMRRLDTAIARERTLEPQNLQSARAVREPPLRAADPWNLRTVIALAAMLALVTLGIVMAARFRTTTDTRVAVTTSPAPTPPLALQGPARPGRALREGSAAHLERSKLVVLGLATRDPLARSEDWQYERTRAGELLTETRLYRQAAIQGGVADVERVMRDLETVLLEASMSEKSDRAALKRVQRLIDRRDLVVKMQVMAASGN